MPKLAERTSWIYCPAVNSDGTPCRHDLNGDDKSYSHESGVTVSYLCARCGFGSVFALDAPAPIYLYPWGFHGTNQCGDICRHCEFHPEKICGRNCSGCCTPEEMG